MPTDDPFDFAAFYRALDATRESRGKSWKQLGQEANVSPSTLARMAQDKRPDASGLASLSAWSGLNPGEFVTYGASAAKAEKVETLAEISRLLSQDASLSAEAANTLEGIIRAAYASMARRDDDPST